MVVLNYSNLMDSVDVDGKCYIQLEITDEACMSWIHTSIKEKDTYNKEDVTNFLNGLLHIEKRNNKNEILHTKHRDDTEEIDLNNSTSSIEYLEDVETNYLNHYETGEETLPNDGIVVDLNNSTSSIECLEDTLPKDEIVDLTKDDLNSMPTKTKDVFKYKKPKRNRKQRQHRMSENCSTIFNWKNSQVWTKKSRREILFIASESSTQNQFGWQSTLNINIPN